jgi:hypothetical protein
MFRAVLYTQWKWTRAALLVASIALFALPVTSVRQAGHGDQEWEAAEVLLSLSAWAPLYPITAALLGTLVAFVAWSVDHQGEHVYALSLPVPRWHFVLLRWSAGGVLLLLPVVALWIGLLLATATAQVPTGLSAYPNALTLRYLLATFVSYALLFVVGQGGKRLVGYLLVAVGAVIVVSVFDAIMGLGLGPANRIGAWLIGPLGPLRVFDARWLPIDV